MIARASRPQGTNRAVVVAVSVGCIAALLVGPIVATSATLAYGVAAVLAIGFLLALSSRQPIGAVLVIAVVLVSALNDLPQRLHVGPTTGQGLETLALVTVMMLAGLNGYGAVGVVDRTRLWPLAAFVAWAVTSFSWGHISQEGIQNVSVYAAFLGMLLIGASVGRWRPQSTFTAVEYAFRTAAVVGLALYGLSLLIEGQKTRLIVSPRPFALFGVILVAWFTAAHLRGSRSAKWFVIATVTLTVLSLSRSALAAQFLIIALGYVGATRNFRTLLRTAVVTAVVVAVALSAVFLYAPLRDRFFTGDVQQVGGVSVNVMGRDAVWSKNWEWFQQKPIIGWGAGSSDNMTAALPPGRLGVPIGHPHNDYLRLLVDFGIVGFALWTFAYARLIRMTWRRWRDRAGAGSMTSQVCCAAFLALAGIGLTMLVDNPLIEIVKMAPLGALVGLALGMVAAERAAETAHGQALIRDRTFRPQPAI
jgi:O-antigen ligase